MEADKQDPGSSSGQPDEQRRRDEHVDGATEDYLPVVGIGASAGGLRALRTFFEAIPAGTGIVFVVVVHLSSEHESSLAELLQASAAIPAEQVTMRTRMEPDHIYVIPPGKNLEITNGHLILTEFEGPRSRHAPIDLFFRTLADTHPDGVGILLSGGGSDGTVGMKAIKERGGLLMAQLPEEAEHDQMPRSAIATGLVDFVLPARELAEHVVELRHKGAALVLPEAPDALPETEAHLLKKILAQLQAHSGHDFSGYKPSTLLRRIARRMRVTMTENLSAYLDYLRGNPSEAQALLKDFLISVTTFFRDEAAFEALQQQIIPKLLEDKTRYDEVRVWVTGCATGEEAYSIGILLLEAADGLEAPPEIQIFATDLDEEALNYGREGLYPEAIEADISAERLRRFFTKEDAYYRIGSELREIVLFASHSLLRDPPFSKLDLISSRNLLIYLQQNLQEKVFGLFHYALRPDGFLFLGSSESTTGGRGLFRTLDKTHRLYKYQQATTGDKMLLPDLPLGPAGAKRIKPRPRIREMGRPQLVTDGELHRQALEAHAPPSLLVDQDHTIIHLSDTAGRYLHLPGGSPTMSVVKVVRKELQIELRAALYTTLAHGEATITRPILVQIEGERPLVQLYVRPVPQEDGAPLALVIFAEGKAPGPEAEQEETAATVTGAQLHQAEAELDTTKERLQATIEESETQQEELKASNEELQSINEEYKSTLEELETSKEELQSTNEELKTVNQELKEKVDALRRANDDLQNLMAATEVATLFLDRNLRIKRFTPPLTKLFNVMPVDRGRPIAHVTHQFMDDHIREDAQRVLETLVPIERDVRHENGQHYLLRILPYRTADDRIEGAVITFVDITRLRNAQEELHRSYERYQLLIESVREYAIFMMDEEGRIDSWNAGAEHLFGYSEGEVLGKPPAFIFTEKDRAAGVFQAEIEAAKRDGQAPSERWHMRKKGAQFWGSGILTALYNEHGVLRGFAKVLRDDTHQVAAEALRQSQQYLQALNEMLEERVEVRTQELRKATERMQFLASELLRAEQKERHRIAQVLHDDLQQRLYGMQMKMRFVQRDVEAGDIERVLKNVHELSEWMEETIERTRHLSIDLSPPILHNEGLKEALLWLRTQMADRHEFEVEVKAEESFQMKDEGLRVLLFQIVRELLFNVVKHAGVNHATVELVRRGEELVLGVRDAGVGFDPEAQTQEANEEGGFGLFSVRERLRLVGGRLEIESAPGAGTSMHVVVPLANS